jgi:hypothetical protein
MQAGDILLFKNETTLIPKLIAWGTGSKYFHVAICVSSSMNLAIEAKGGRGVRAIDTRKIPSEYDVFRVKEGLSYEVDKTISYMVDKLNQRYDYLGVLYLALLKLLSKLGLPLRRKPTNGKERRIISAVSLFMRRFFMGEGLI